MIPTPFNAGPFDAGASLAREANNRAVSSGKLG
jgi:hypothetical protein